MADPLPNREVELPNPGEYYNPRRDDNWADILHNALDELSINALVSGSDKSNFEPRDGTLFLPSDGDGKLWLGDGSSWIDLGGLHDPVRIDNLDSRTSRQTVKAADHGADASGSTSSAAALQAAVDEADPYDRVVWGSSGTFYLDDQITINKPIEIDLYEGTIESDYHDEQAHPDDQDHYMPLFLFRGSYGTEHTIQADVTEGSDQVDISDPSGLSRGDGVVLRNATPTLGGTQPGYDYEPTVTRVREVQDGIVYLEDGALRDYSTADGHVLQEADLITRPIIKNISVTSRTEPYFDSDKGKTLGGPRHVLSTELTDHARLENIRGEHYDSHVWMSYDDREPSAYEMAALYPLNLSGSCGEPFPMNGVNTVHMVRPKVKEARRGIDMRSGAGKVEITEPDITGISFVGLSWHSTSTGRTDAVVNGGRVWCKPDDPTMDNKDGSDDTVRQEMQAGRPATTATNATLSTHDVDFVGRQDMLLKGPANITGGRIYKDRSAGTVVTLNGKDIDITDTVIGSEGRVTRLVGTDSDTDAADCTLSNVHFDTSGNPSRAVELLGGENIAISGHVSGSDTATAGIDVEGGTNLDFDLDMTVSGNYAAIIYGGDDIDIRGRFDGGVSNESIRIDGGTNIDIDAEIHCSGATDVRGVRLLGGSDITITGSYRGPGIGVMFSGAANNTTIREMRVEVTDPDRAAAVGTDGNVSGLTNVRWLHNDLRGSVDDILMNDDVDGFWAVNNVCSGVDYTSGTTVAQVYGNGADAAAVLTQDHEDASNPHGTTLEDARSADPTLTGRLESDISVNDFWTITDASDGSNTNAYTMRFDDRDIRLYAGGDGGVGDALVVGHDTGDMTAGGDITSPGTVTGDTITADSEMNVPVYDGSDPANGNFWIREDL